MNRQDYLHMFNQLDKEVADLQQQLKGKIEERDLLSPEAALLNQLVPVQLDSLVIHECFIHDQQVYRLIAISDTGNYPVKCTNLTKDKSANFSWDALVWVVKRD